MKKKKQIPKKVKSKFKPKPGSFKPQQEPIPFDNPRAIPPERMSPGIEEKHLKRIGAL